MTATLLRTTRLRTSTHELDEAELRWWADFADVEERFCWVQTRAIQRFLRGRYLRRIVDLTSPGGRVAEIGCGTGWLCTSLARMGAGNVVGIDFSEDQLRLARARSQAAGVGNRVDFLCADVSHAPCDTPPSDVVVIHGVLHHLTTSEIRRVLEMSKRILTENGRLVVFEPVVYESSGPDPEAERLCRLQSSLEAAPSRLRRWLRGRPGDEETRARELIAGRWRGELPNGPSPKELPFAPEELPDLLAPLFYVEDQRQCMAASHLVAQELLLVELSQRWLSRLMKWPLLAAARYLERRVLALKEAPSSMWIFEMFECAARHATA